MSKPSSRWCTRGVSPLLLTALLVGCAGPERMPRVDLENTGRAASEEYRRKQEAAEPEQNDREETAQGAKSGDAPVDPRAAWERMTTEFADEVAANTGGLKGWIAVFPPLLRTGATNAWSVSEVGERMAEEIALRLRAAGRQVLAGDSLRAAIAASNRGLDALVDEPTALALAGRLSGLLYVQAATTGTIDVIQESGFSGARRVEFALRATNLAESGPIARKDLRIVPTRAAVAAEKELAKDGSWRIGANAEPFRPTVDREIDVLATAALVRILDRSPELILGRRVAVLPLEVGATAAAARELAVFQQGVHKALESAEKKAKADGAADPLQAALDKPLTVGGREYASGNDALLEYSRRRAEVFGSRAGALAQGIADAMGETLRRIAGDRITIVQADDRHLAVSLVKADMLEMRTDHSIDPGTLGTVSSQAPDVVVRAALRQRIEDYVLTVRVFDLADPNRSRTETVDLEPWMVGPIRSQLMARAATGLGARIMADTEPASSGPLTATN